MAEDPANDATLRTIGNVLVSNTIAAALFTTLYGMYLVVTFLSWTLLWSKRENRRFFQMRLLVFSVCIFILTTALWVGQIFDRVQQIQSILVAGPSISFPERLAKAFAIRRLTIASFWIASINSLYADAILVWRCWIISPTLRNWTFFAMFLWVIYCMAALVANIAVGITSSVTPVFRYASTAGLVASFLVNVAATSTIAVTVLYRRRLKRSTTRWRTPAVKIGLVFVESGLFYSFLQFCILILHLLVGYSQVGKNNSVVTAAAASYQCLAYLGALYPTVVVIIVHVNRSFLDTTMFPDEEDEGSGSLSDASTSSIVFAPPQTTPAAPKPLLLDPMNNSIDEASSGGNLSQYKYGTNEYTP